MPARRAVMTAAATVAALLGVLLQGERAGAQATRSCAGTFADQRITNNLTVPDGATCELLRVELLGFIRVRPGASLVVRESRTSGIFDTNGAASIVIQQSRIAGNITVVQTGALYVADTEVQGFIDAEETPYVVVFQSRAGSVEVKRGGTVWLGGAIFVGDVQIEGNAGPVTVVATTVDGFVRVQATAGAVHLSENRIDGYLRCLLNSGAVTYYANFSREGQGQCA